MALPLPYLHSVSTRYGRYRRVFLVLEKLVERISSSEYIVLVENKKISYETKGYRLWMKFKKNKTIIEYHNPTVQDYDIWYTNQYLGHLVAGKYSKILFYVAALTSLTLVSLNPGYANIAVLVVGVFIVLDYIVHVYYNWSLVKMHQEAYRLIPSYRTRYDMVREEILGILKENTRKYTRTTVFLNKTWFKKTSDNRIILAKHPI